MAEIKSSCQPEGTAPTSPGTSEHSSIMNRQSTQQEKEYSESGDSGTIETDRGRDTGNLEREKEHWSKDTVDVLAGDNDGSGSISDSDTDDEASYASSSQVQLEHDDNELPITSMKQLVETFFGNNGAHRPRYSDAQVRMRRPSTAPLDDRYISMLTHDCVLHFLAPHEMLALWRTSGALWRCMVPKQRMFVMLRSVFSYLRISEEAAQHLDSKIIGGWQAYCPLMVSLCEHLARVYGHFELDPAHRVFMAHQACFFPKSRPFWRCGSELAEHEVRLAHVLDFRDRHVINYSHTASKLLPPTLDVLMNDSPVGWGDPEYYFERERRKLPRASTFSGDVLSKTIALKKHYSWMSEHGSEAPNKHYRMRLERGLSPCIWVDQYGVHHSPHNGLELQIWALGIGSKKQQFIGALSAGDSLELPRSFAHCLEYDPTNESFLRGGFMELILRRSHCVGMDIGTNYDDKEFTPMLGLLIWCMHRGLEPLADARIDWQAVIDDVCRRDSDLFRRLYREELDPWDPFGPHAPRPDPVDDQFVEREKHFYSEALVSPVFGPADFRNYI